MGLATAGTSVHLTVLRAPGAWWVPFSVHLALLLLFFTVATQAAEKAFDVEGEKEGEKEREKDASFLQCRGLVVRES